jgi:hypothetical protein
VLGFKTAIEEGSITVTELKCTADFMVKNMIYISNAVRSDFLSSVSKQQGW